MPRVSPGRGWVQRRLPALVVAVAAACGPTADPDAAAHQEAPPADSVPPRLAGGAAMFAQHCAPCHGAAALGTEQGPPLVHGIYEPGHHGDAAFVLAVTRGVRAHHWRFGDMPPVPGLTTEDAAIITAYVRWLQNRAGIR